MSSISTYRIGTRFTNALNAFCGFNLLDDAIADIFGLVTLRHGTSLSNYNGIMLTGPDPQKGGLGLSDDDQNAINKFFVISPNIPKIFQDIAVRYYAISLSTGEAMLYTCFSPILSFPIGYITGSLSPIVKLRVDPLFFSAHFKPVDNDIGSLSIDRAISPDQIGLYGSLTQGLNGKFCERFKNDPKKFFGGLVKLILALAILALPIIAGLHCNNTLHWVQLSDYTLNALKIALIAYGAFKGLQVTVRFFAPLAYN